MFSCQEGEGSLRHFVDQGQDFLFRSSTSYLVILPPRLLMSQDIGFVNALFYVTCWRRFHIPQEFGWRPRSVIRTLTGAPAL
jgi:hypothetical protein